MYTTSLYKGFSLRLCLYCLCFVFYCSQYKISWASDFSQSFNTYIIIGSMYMSEGFQMYTAAVVVYELDVKDTYLSL